VLASVVAAVVLASVVDCGVVPSVVAVVAVAVDRSGTLVNWAWANGAAKRAKSTKACIRLAVRAMV